MSDTFLRAKVDIVIVSVLFFVSVALFFAPVSIPYKLALPVGVLFIASLKLLPWQMSFAMLFSCAGDFFGSCGNFMAQMIAFAIAHIFIICYFFSRYRLGVLRRRYMRYSSRYMTFATVFVLPVLLFAFVKIVPCVPAGVLRYGVSFYAILIATMVWGALQQRSKLFAIGAVLFLVSDMILAWNRFVRPLPDSTILILVPYYFAQWLLFMRSTKWWGRHMERE
ncbi:MAG: lysoplasmalogenase [Bacteroidaceae bacterium]|nr:lysoplasmalogenase [Bacteroidaceae bacterium]